MIQGVFDHLSVLPLNSRFWNFSIDFFGCNFGLSTSSLDYFDDCLDWSFGVKGQDPALDVVDTLFSLIEFFHSS